MTLEEGIEYYERLAENQKRILEKYPSQSGKEVIDRFTQLIEWLEELRAYREEMKSYYAVKFTGLDASGNVHTFTTDLDGYDKENAKKKLYSFADVYGIKIVKIMNFASFADPAGAIWQVEKWNKLLLSEKS